LRQFDNSGVHKSKKKHTTKEFGGEWAFFAVRRNTCKQQKTIIDPAEATVEAMQIASAQSRNLAMLDVTRLGK